MKVMLIEKAASTWSPEETDSLRAIRIEVLTLPGNPYRLVIMKERLDETISKALGHENFTSRQVDYVDRWK